MENKTEQKKIDEKKYSQETSTMLDKFNDFVVKNDQDYQDAAEVLTRIKARLKLIHEEVDPVVSKAHEAHKSVCDLRGRLTSPLEKTQEHLKKQVNDYDTEKQRKIDEENARLEAERQAEEDAERKRLEDAAAKAEKAGQVNFAVELKEQAETVVIPAAPAAVEQTPKMTHTSCGKTGKGKETEVTIDNELMVLKAIVSGKIPMTCVEIKPTKIKAWANTQGHKTLNQWGLKIRQVSNIRVY